MTPEPVTVTARVERRYALTRLQSEVWASQRLHPDAPLANMATTHRISGALDPDRFVDAVDAVVRACDVLRTRMATGSGGAIAEVLAAPPQRTEVRDLPAADLAGWCSTRVAQPIDATTCCYDSVLLRHGPDDWTWWLDLHHLVTDATSQALVHELVARAYEGESPSPSSFADHAAQVVDDRPPGASEVASSPLRPFGTRGPITTHSHRSPVVMDEAASRDLAARVRATYPSISAELSIAAVSAVALACTMHRFDGRAEFTIGMPVSHRSGRRRRLIGPLMEMRPIDVSIRPGDTFATLVDRTQAGIIEMLRRSRPGRSAPTDESDRSGAPLRSFEMVVNVFRAEAATIDEHPVEVSWMRAPHVDPAHSLRLHAFDYGDELQIELDVNAGLRAGDHPPRFDRHLARVISAMLAEPAATIDSVSIATPDDRAATAALIPSPPERRDGRPVHEVIADRLRAEPEWVVIEDRSEVVTAADFDERVERCRRWLVAEGVEHGDRVGLRMERSVDVLVAMHAILRSGAAFVMLDPSDPPARHDAIAADADLRLIVDDLADAAGRVDAEAVADPGPGPVRPDDIAYVLYTSGSTGRPKGVPISHAGLADYLAFASDEYGTDVEPPVVALHSALVFDLTITSLFLSFLTGGLLIVFPGDPVVALGRVAADDRITFLKATPSQLEVFCRMTDAPRPLRTVVVGGEAFRRPVAVATARACAPGVRIFNEYGPTEAVVGCMIHRWDPDLDVGPDVPIGHATPGCEVALLDPFGHPTPAGAWGELYVRRVGMAHGYLGRPELSAARFVDLDDVPGSLGGAERGPWYRTGDRARIERDGVATYGGRLDDQMKVNGVRLEPAEVEAALVDHPRVASALVRLWTPADRVSDARCVRCGLGTDVPGLEIDATGTCSMCHEYEAVAPQTEAWFRTEDDLADRLAAARERSTGDYDCLHLLSGGKDSSYALYQLVARGWRVHALTLDNGFISDGAKDNIRRSIDALGITHEFATTDAMNEIFRDSLDRHSNVCQGCYKTIYTKAVARADELGIPVIVTGLSRGQFFETRLIPAQFEAGRFDPDAIDATVLEARKVYHHVPDAVTELLPEQRVFDDDAVFDRIEFVDFYRYVDVDLAELYRYLEENAPWVRPADTGRSTNCLINVAGIQVHQAERGFHNYAEPYSWDVRLGHKTRDEALGELDDQLEDGVDDPEVRRLLDIVGYQPKQVEILTAWYRTIDGADIDPDELRRHVRDRVSASAVPAAFVRIDEMPMAASAKADPSALPAPSRLHRKGAALVEPTTEVERALCAIWAEALRLEHVGVTDDFFELGGDSLAALEVVAAIADTMRTGLDDAAVFHARTVRELAASINASVDHRGGSLDAAPPITPVAGVPLTAGEEAMLFEHRRDPSDTRYNVTRWYRLPAATDLGRLERAIRDVAMVHQPLHRAYDPARAELGPDRAVAFVRHEDMSGFEFRTLAEHVRAEPFDLESGPLVRVHAAITTDDETGERDASLLIGMHHISIDAGSFDEFWDQVDRAASGRPLTPPTITSAAHGEWQRREVHPRHVEYWSHERRAAADRPAPGRLALDAPMPPEPDGYLSQPLGVTIGDLRRAPGRTPFVTSLTAAAATLARFSGGPHVELGITASVKDHPGVDALVGYFLNTLPVRIDATAHATFADVAAVADDVMAAAIEHRTFPFADIVRDARAAGLRPPDVSAMLAYERLAPARLDGVEVGHEILASGTAVAAVTLFVQERGDDLAVGVEYSGRVVSGRDAQRLLDTFAATLRGAVDAPDAPLAALVPDGEVAADLEGAALPVGAPTVLHAIADRLLADPEAAAVVDVDGRIVTSAELMERAAATADLLTRAGHGGRGRLVGVCVGRGVDMVVAILGVQLSGAGYVPLDPSSPSGRLEAIVDSVELSTVLVDAANRHRFSSTTDLDGGVADRPPVAATWRAGVDAVEPGDTAYVIFTSGSTGTPRGVAVSHANLVASTAAREVAYDLPPERFLLTSSIGFDSSVVGLFWPLVSGGAIVLAGDDDVHDVDRLVDLIDRAGVTHLLMVPSLYRGVLLRARGRLGSLRAAIVAGEACSPEVAALHRSVLGAVPLYDEYGPTEATVWASVHRVDETDRASVPIGRPIAGVTLRVAEPDGTPTLPGVAGELLVAGPTVTGGYLDDDDATRSRFVVVDARRWYRTGDLVRVGTDGAIRFLGRLDDQLNVGGVRIEPGEIEVALTALPEVSEAVVVASPAVDGRLVAHVAGGPLDEDDVRRRLAARLPATHVPSRVVAHPSLPRTTHGKLDRARARDLAVGAISRPDPETTSTRPLVDEVVAVWRRVLRRPDIDAGTDYFEAGGDSLAAVEIVTALEAMTGADVTIGVLLDGRTPAGVAARLAHGAAGRGVGAAASGQLIVMQPGASNGPLLVLTPGWDDVFGYQDLVAALPDHVRVIALSAANVDADRLVTTIPALGEVFVDLLRSDAPDDLARRVTVLGWSTGGVAAYELADRLRRLDVDVQRLAMVDTFFPGAEQHLWSNRWWKYKSLATPSALANEVSTTIRRRTQKYARSIGTRLLRYSGTPVPDAPERTSTGGVPLEAFGYRPPPTPLEIVFYAASTTNPARTHRAWVDVAVVDVVPVEGRHRGYRSIMGEARVAEIADDLARRLAHTAD